MTCAQCEADITHRTVTLVLDDDNDKVLFCSDACERRWMKSELVRLRRDRGSETDRLRKFLTRIYIQARGRARAIAKTALHTNEQP